jgi:large subunit ribosomal protein L21
LVGEARATKQEARKSVAASRRTQARASASADRTVSKAPGASRSASKTEKLESRPKQELMDLAAAKGISGRSSMTKADLVKALR